MTVLLPLLLHRRSTRSGWSGHGRTTFQPGATPLYWYHGNSIYMTELQPNIIELLRMQSYETLQDISFK